MWLKTLGVRARELWLREKGVQNEGQETLESDEVLMSFRLTQGGGSGE